MHTDFGEVNREGELTMRKGFVFLIILLLTAGCRQDAGIREQLDAENRTYQEVITVDQNTVVYYTDYQQIFIQKGKQEHYISDDFSSMPVLSPDRRTLAYITPFEFELLGELHLYEISDDTNKAVVQVEELTFQECVKSVTWLDNRYLLTVIGFGYGTVSQGGSLYVYDRDTEELTQVLTPEDEWTEIVSTQMQASDIIIDLARHNDDFTDHVIEQEHVSIEEIMALVD